MSSWWDKTKTYCTRVVGCYLEFAVPVAILLAFNVAAASNSSDVEKNSLLWLHAASMSDEERDSKFPVHEPGSRRARKAEA
jgi:hypothetical protein